MSLRPPQIPQQMHWDSIWDVTMADRLFLSNGYISNNYESYY